MRTKEYQELTCHTYECGDDYPTYTTDTFRVNPETSEKFPAIVRFVSLDTCDRTGRIRADDLTIISLVDIADKKMMFL